MVAELFRGAPKIRAFNTVLLSLNPNAVRITAGLPTGQAK